jgi:hypothetical protein
MAYYSGSYSSPTGLLDTIRGFAIANGWTSNGYSSDGTGYRLHLRSPDSALFCNLRSGVNENIFSGAGGDVFTGIGLNMSTGYSSGNAWDSQPGTGSMSGGGGAVSSMFTSAGGTYKIFVHDHLICVFALLDLTSNWGQLCMGKTTLGVPVYAASLSFENSYSSINNSFMIQDNSGNTEKYKQSAYVNGDWTVGDSGSPPMVLCPTVPNPSKVGTTYYMAETLISNSRNQLRGNSLLIPTYMCVTNSLSGLTGGKVYIGHIEGLVMLAGDIYNNEDTVQYGVDEYVISTPAPTTEPDAYYIKVACKK